MVSAFLFWVLGILLFTGAAVTATVVYAALVIASRTDAIVGECAHSDEKAWNVENTRQPRGFMREQRLHRRTA